MGSLAEKTSTKADLESDVQAAKDTKLANTKQLMATLEYTQSLHAECDWLLKYFDVRKTARAGEVDALKNAKAVLSGADYSFIQVSSNPVDLESLRAEVLDSKVFRAKVDQACKGAGSVCQ